MSPHPLLTLADRWRAQAGDLRNWSAATQANVLEQAADELEGWVNQLLSPAEAAEETPHMAESTIRNKLGRGELENHGKPGSPLVRRGDLWGVPERPEGEMRDFVRRRVAGGH